jgi:hypothetical protein
VKFFILEIVVSVEISTLEIDHPAQHFRPICLLFIKLYAFRK